MDNEFSRIVTVDSLQAGEKRCAIAAEPAELSLLAARLGVPRIDRLEADLTLRRVESDARIVLRGRFRAEVEQICVVSLEPMSTIVEERFTVHYAAAGGWEDREEYVIVEIDDENSPEPLIDGEIDLGEAVSQQLVLALDPYPRKPGAAVPAFEKGGGTDADTDSPFAVLAALKKGD